MTEPEISKEYIETLADMYIEEMENRFLNNEAYFNALEVAADIRKGEGFSARNTLKVTEAIRERHAARLIEMGYDLGKPTDSSFYLKTAL